MSLPVCRALLVFPLAATLLGCGPAKKQEDVQPQTTVSPAVPLTPASLQDALHDAWELRDRLEAWDAMGELQFDSDRWLPTEYAPHLWRRLNTLLLDLDLRSRGGAAFDKGELEEQVVKYGRGLQALETGGEIGKDLPTPLPKLGLAQTAVYGRLQGELAKFASRSPDLNTVGRCVRYYQRLCYRIRDFVRWYPQASCILDGEGEALFAKLRESLDRLLKVKETLASLNGQRLDSERTRQLRIMITGLERTRQELEGILEGAVSEADHWQWESLLGTSLLSAAQRAQLTKAIALGNTYRAPERTAAAPSAMRPEQLTQSQVQSLQHQLELERKLLALSGVVAMEELEQLQELQLAIGEAKDEAERWNKVRGAGERLREHWAQLPAQILATGDPAQAQAALVLVDARDADQLEDKWLLPRLDILPPLREFQIVSSGQLRPTETGWQEVDLDVILPDHKTYQLVVTADFPEAELAIRRKDNLQRLTPEQPVQFELTSQGAIEFEVQALRPRREIELQGEIGFTVTVGQEVKRSQVEYQLPQPDVIELVVERLAAAGSRQPAPRIVDDALQALRVKPFPNRETTYHFALKNLSDKRQVVDVDLFAVQRPDGANFRPGKLQQDGKLFPGIARGQGELLASARGIELPADELPHAISFGDKSAEESTAGAEGTTREADEKTPDDTPPPEGKDVTHGIQCLVRNPTTEKQWMWWVEFDVLRPSEFLDVSSEYSPGEGRIKVSIGPRDNRQDELPGNLAEVPVEIYWERQFDAKTKSAQGNFFGQLDAQNRRVDLWAKLAGEAGDPFVITLAVDEYPRAFVHRLDINRDTYGRDFRPQEKTVTIQTLAMGNRVFRTSESVPVPKTDKEQEIELRPVRAADNSVAFKADNQPLVVSLMVDAPQNAFAKAGQDDIIQLSWEKANPALYSDRSISITLLAATADGRITLDSRVADHVVLLPTQDLQGVFPLVLSGRYGMQEFPQSAEVNVFLDADPPQVQLFEVDSNTIEIGQKIRVRLQVEDLSGVAQVKLGLTSKRGDTLPEDAAYSADIPDLSRPIEFVPDIKLDPEQKPPQEFWLQCTVVDRVKAETTATSNGKFQPIRMYVSPAAAELTAEKPEPEIRGELRGFVYKGRLTNKTRRITVELEGSGKKIKTASDGTFRFADVPAGEHTLKAAGPYQGGQVSGELKVKIEKQEDFDRVLELELKSD